MTGINVERRNAAPNEPHAFRRASGREATSPVVRRKLCEEPR